MVAALQIAPFLGYSGAWGLCNRDRLRRIAHRFWPWSSRLRVVRVFEAASGIRLSGEGEQTLIFLGDVL